MNSNEKDRKLNLVRGSLIGGAAGDALGYPVEFNSYRSIIDRYGKPGITEYDLDGGVAKISDDTQMTLFTANGMLLGLTRGFMRGVGSMPEFCVEYAYKDWYNTQMKSYESVMAENENRHSWLSAIPQLYARRAPGNTCLAAIREIMKGETPQNDSKGCGGVMRVSPYALFSACHEMRYKIENIDVAGGEIARLTHKHPLGWFPAIVLTHIIYRLVKDGGFDGLDKSSAVRCFSGIVNEALQLLPSLKVMCPVSEMTWDQERTIGEVFPNAVVRQRELVERALLLAGNDQTDIENITRLGQGWVGEETLAIAVYAVARHIDSFEDTLVAAVNHDGDSDSTGAVAGNIIGAIVGYDAIPDKFTKNLELHDVILSVANDLHQGCIIAERDLMNTPEKIQWYERYCKMEPSGF
ncbi:MAG: ADP-ribosylglycohydrolase family protein [Prevotella sp.]|nr:ADP-ribosylglycohydrolase family protein [Prevotella sp.]